MKKTILLIALVTLFANESHSQENIFNLEQSGRDNDVTVSQIGTYNLADINQSGNENAAAVSQNGQENETWVNQSGNRNLAGVSYLSNSYPNTNIVTRIEQSGNQNSTDQSIRGLDNVISVNQAGNYNVAVQTGVASFASSMTDQSGNLNEAYQGVFDEMTSYINQSGNRNFAEISNGNDGDYYEIRQLGNDNFASQGGLLAGGGAVSEAYIVQSGKNNDAIQILDLDLAYVKIDQSGDFNRAEQNVESYSNTLGIIEQSGNNNMANQYQFSFTDNEMYIIQSGNNNVASQHQDGTNHFFIIEQSGNENVANQFQDGGSNFAQISQSGNSNHAEQFQYNDGFGDEASWHYGAINQSGNNNSAVLEQYGTPQSSMISQPGNGNFVHVVQNGE